VGTRIGLLLAAGLLAAAPVQAQQKDPARESRKKIFRDYFLDHFTLGVEAPTEWLIETREKNGARWDCSVAYLSGAAGTGEQPYWLRWSPIRQRIQACKRAGVIPWFTYYLLAASAPARYKPGPAKATPVNAKVPETMKDYFGLFKTLMQECAKEAPYPVMVQIEPDEWGHLLIPAGMDPTKVDVKVGSCGLEELRGLPDNLFGYADAFRKLRDLFAPSHVLLGCNPSGWDWQGSMSGTRFGAIMKQVAGEYDFAVFETGDRDKGMHGRPPPYTNTIDITGNLENHLKWIADFHAATGLYVFVWQVAAGNTYFSTCDNTPGHFCDNLAQLILEDYPRNPTISRYVKAGCAGWMFHGGQEPSTRVYDQKKDGVTNPAPIPGNLGNKSEYPDDDGGYLRLRGGNYYKSPFPILGKPVAAKPSNGGLGLGLPKPPPKTMEAAPVDPAALTAWDTKLLSAVRGDLQAQRYPRFHLRMIDQTTEIHALDDAGAMVLRSSGGEFRLRWADLNLPDRRNLAVGRVRETKPAEDMALAAFYNLACGSAAAAEEFLQKIPAAEAESIRDVFKKKT
jgi:hypothetical protein